MVCLLALCVCAVPATVLATEDEDLEAEIARLQGELAGINSNIASLQGDIANSAELKRQYQLQQEALEELLAANSESISETETQILEKQKEIGEKIQSIYAQQELFEERMVAVYKNRNEGALSTLLSVNSFSELLTVSNSLQRITQHDTELIQTLSREKAELELEEQELEALVQKLDGQNEQHQQGIQQLAGSIAAQNEELDDLQAKQAAEEAVAADTQSELDQAIAAKAQQDAALAAVAAAAAEAERQRQAEQEEYERQLREAQEQREQQEQQQQEQQEQGEGGEGEEGDGGEPQPQPEPEPIPDPTPPSANEHNGSVSVWPVPGFRTVTCEFGTPDSAGTGHYGMDIAGGGIAGAPVVAAGGGTVIVAGWNSSYGNYVSIDHGNGVVTLYAHLQGYTVGVGQYVSAGSTIGYVGNTGFVISFGGGGYHLHFEVHVNGRRQNPRNYV